jgi:hypothetical protein
MSQVTADKDEVINHKRGGAMRIFIFKSEANPDLRAFGGDLAGIKLPGQFKPWRAVGTIAPNQDPPYKIARDDIERRLTNAAFSFFDSKNGLKPFRDKLMWQPSETVETLTKYRS